MSFFYAGLGPNNSRYVYWLTYKCTSCGDAVIAKLITNSYTDDPQQLTNSNLYQEVIETIPSLKIIPENWPQRAAKYYSQALASEHAPDGCIMLAASTVDALLKERGLTKGTLYERIEAAVKSHLLTADMGEWAHAVRLESNNPRHVDLDKPHADKEDAKNCLLFVKTLGEILYTLPARIASGKEAAEQGDGKQE
jgi:hypothetical protein